MQRKRLFALSGATAVAAIVTLVCIAPRSSSLPAAAATVRFIGRDNPRRGVTFWVINQTQRTINLRINQVELRVAGAWSNCGLNGAVPEIRFQESDCIWTTMLNPHAAGRGTVQQLAMPETGPWRVRASVSQELTGPSYLLAGVKAFFSALCRDHQLQNPFPKGQVYFGPSREVLSEEISCTATDRTAASR